MHNILMITPALGVRPFASTNTVAGIPVFTKITDRPETTERYFHEITKAETNRETQDNLGASWGSYITDHKRTLDKEFVRPDSMIIGDGSKFGEPEILRLITTNQRMRGGDRTGDNNSSRRTTKNL